MVFGFLFEIEFNPFQVGVSQVVTEIKSQFGDDGGIRLSPFPQVVLRSTGVDLSLNVLIEMAVLQAGLPSPATAMTASLSLP